MFIKINLRVSESSDFVFTGRFRLTDTIFIVRSHTIRSSSSFPITVFRNLPFTFKLVVCLDNLYYLFSQVHSSDFHPSRFINPLLFFFHNWVYFFPLFTELRVHSTCIDHIHLVRFITLTFALIACCILVKLLVEHNRSLFTVCECVVLYTLDLILHPSIFIDRSINNLSRLIRSLSLSLMHVGFSS